MAKAPKKRGSQDATRKYDVAPLRRRIEKLEQAVDDIARTLKSGQTYWSLRQADADTAGKRRRSSAMGRRRG